MKLDTFRSLLWAAASVYTVFPDMRRFLHHCGWIFVQVEEGCKGDVNSMTVDGLWSIFSTVLERSEADTDKGEAENPNLPKGLIRTLNDTWGALFYFGILVGYCQYLKTRRAEAWIERVSAELAAAPPKSVVKGVKGPKSSPRKVRAKTLATPPTDGDVVAERCRDRSLQPYIRKPFWRSIELPPGLLDKAMEFQARREDSFPPLADFLVLDVDKQCALALTYCMHGARGKNGARMSVNLIAVTLLGKRDHTKLYGMIRVLGVPNKHQWAQQCAARGVVVPIRSDAKSRSARRKKGRGASMASSRSRAKPRTIKIEGQQPKVFSKDEIKDILREDKDTGE